MQVPEIVIIKVKKLSKDEKEFQKTQKNLEKDLEKKRIQEEKERQKTQKNLEKQLEKKRIQEEKEAEKLRIKAEKEAEKKRIQAEKEAEKKRIQVEKEAEKLRIKQEKDLEKQRQKTQKMIQKQEEKSNRKTQKLDIRVEEPMSSAPKELISCEPLNEKLANIMNQLSEINAKNGEHFKARAYANAEETILSITEDICSLDQLLKKPGIGKTTMEKMQEYVSTGKVETIEEERNRPENILSDVYGIGPQKAKELVQVFGITTIDELRERQDQVLNNVQKMGLRHYEDILKKIPREEIDQYNSIFANEFGSAVFSKDPDAKFEIVGSYRRGKMESGDIDVIFTSNNPKLFVAFIDSLIRRGIIIEVLSRGKSKCLVITRLSPNVPARRVDFLYTNHKEFPFSILYFTGSKAFNTVMRGHALSMGLTMNEHGFSKILENKKTEKLQHEFADEKSIFDYLGLVYKSPEERVNGRAVILKSGNEEKIEDLPIKEVKVSSPVSPIMQHIADFQKHGIRVLQGLTESQLSEIIRFANEMYYNQTPVLSDNEFDIIKEYTEKRFPKNQAITEIGAVITKNKIQLPYEMASMDKIKPDTDALPRWIMKYQGPYVLSCKLDGVSGMYYRAENGEYGLYTRGDGKIGQNVTHLLGFLKLPQIAPGCAIRGEFIIPKDVFETKYKGRFSNSRNMVSGVVNSRTMDETVLDVHFVVYEIISPTLMPIAQLETLTQMGFETVKYTVINSGDLTNESLSEILMQWRSEYAYEIDGIIVTNNGVYPRKSGNPDHAFAFKMIISDQFAEAKVVDVIWTPSKNGVLKPRVQIEPINIGGVRIEYATGFNGKYIEDHHIGIGAVITIIRSGDVIPYIKNIVVPAERTKMPDVPYIWNNTHVDVLLENADEDETVREKNITVFFVTLKVEGLSSGNVKRIINAGYDSVAKILAMTKYDFENVEGFKSKMIEKIYGNIHQKVASASLIDIMVASNRMGKGLGDKKIRPIMETFPDILISNASPENKIRDLKTIKGIGKENAAEFVNNIPNFLGFLREIGLESKLTNEPAPIIENQIKEEISVPTHILNGKKIVMTKTRDKDTIEALKKYGATLEDNMKKDIFVLIVKSKDDHSNKMDYAKTNGIPIMTVQEFRDAYL